MQINISLDFVSMIITAVTLAFSLFIFFSDTILRWKFFGYRPTAIAAIYDPKIKSILMVKQRRGLAAVYWNFNQGGLYSNDLVETTGHIIKRELGIAEHKYKLEDMDILYKVKFSNGRKEQNQKILGSLSITDKIRGKGYIACYIEADLKGIEKQLLLGVDILEAKVFKLDEAIKMIEEIGDPAYQYKKDITLKILRKIDKVIVI